MIKEAKIDRISTGLGAGQGYRLASDDEKMLKRSPFIVAYIEEMMHQIHIR